MSKLAQLIGEAIAKDPVLLQEIQNEIVKSATPVPKAKPKTTKKVAKAAAPKKTTKKKTTSKKKKAVKPRVSQQIEPDLNASVVSGEELEIIEQEIEKIPTVKRAPVKSQDFEIPEGSSLKTRHARMGLQRREPQFITGDASFKPNFIQENAVIKATREEIDRRPPAQKIRVKCHVCGVEERISEALRPLSYGRDGKALYRCNDCR